MSLAVRLNMGSLDQNHDFQGFSDESVFDKVLFGRKDLSDCYRKAQNLVIQNKLLRMCQLVDMGATKQITICNLWRIERDDKPGLRLYEYCLEKNLWMRCDDASAWPNIPLLNIMGGTGLKWWEHVVTKVLDKALMAAGYADLLVAHHPAQSFDRITGKPIGSMAEMTPWKMRSVMGRHYLKRVIKKGSMEPGVRALTAGLWQHIVSRDIISARMVITSSAMSLNEYLHYAKHESGFLKVAREHRNLLPLLQGINPEYWDKDDLFSRKRWVKNGRKTTSADRLPMRISNETRGFNRPGYLPVISSYDHACSWRWVMRASPLMVRLVITSRKDVINNLALARISEKAPVCAYVAIMGSSWGMARMGVDPKVQAFQRIYLQHAARMWKAEGFAKTREWVKRSHRSCNMVADYLMACGFDAGFPDRNSTWVSLSNRSIEWHRLAHDNNVRRMNENHVWDDKCGIVVMGEFEFTPLLSTDQLYEEGQQMFHCIGSYSRHCFRGDYRAFSVKGLGEQRSTLGIVDPYGNPKIDQHYAYDNQPISAAQKKAGEEFLKHYIRLDR